MLISTVNIIAAVCAFLRTGIDMRFFYGRDNDYGCTVSIIYETLTQTFSLLTAYYVLWLRQRVFYQIIILTLFIYPLVKHYRSSKIIRNNPTQPTRNPVIALIKRTTVATVVSIVTDISSFVITLFFEDVGSKSYFVRCRCSHPFDVSDIFLRRLAR